MKVAQIARTIAEIFSSKYATDAAKLGGIDPDAAEAAGLAHDLGHPPFGHIAEHELNRLVRLAGVPDGFEGNAQSLRIVCRLSVSDAVTIEDEASVSVTGLNLTRSTMAGLVKYPWAHGENAEKPNKWGYYSEEKEFFEWARYGCPPHQKTLIAEVMDWADDITYAIHDLLDFYRAGLIPLELVRQVDDAPSSVERAAFLNRLFERRPEWASNRSTYEAALDRILDSLPFDLSHRYSGAEAEEQTLFQFATTLISRYVNSIKPAAAIGPSVVDIQREAREEVDVLKEFVWQYVILNPAMAQLQVGQRRAVRVVFRESLRAARKNQMYFFPGPFRKWLADAATNAQIVRLAADYAAGMTERELMRAYKRFQGANEG
jgi:dGTPase